MTHGRTIRPISSRRKHKGRAGAALAFSTLSLLVPLKSQAAAKDLRGVWLVEKGEARVAIGPCESSLCGKIVWTRDSLDATGHLRNDSKNPDPTLRKRLVCGLVILTEVEAVSEKGRRRWKGRIYDPKSGHTYTAKLELVTDDLLKIRGYVRVPLLGRTTRWTRAGP